MSHPTGEDMQGLSTEELSWPSRHPYGIAWERGYGPDGLPVDSEYSWAGGLTPKPLENASPLEGGRYRGTAPRSGLRIGISRDARG